MGTLSVADPQDVFGYLARELSLLGEKPLSDVDSLALACMSYFRLPEEAAAARTRRGMPVADLLRAEWFEPMTRSLWDPDGLVRLLAAVVASPRLRGMRVSDYVDVFDEAAEQQFSACVLRLPDGNAYVSFRGTDNTLVGWKEDFNMAFETGVPSQLAAVEYLDRVARGFKGRLFVGGHSKGGNLAVYAAVNCHKSTFDKVERVFSHDGPGFTTEAMAAVDWAERVGKVSKTVPESSMIGMMFERQEDYAVVRSTQSGVTQHDPFSWVVEDSDFARADEISAGAGYVDESLNQWVANMSHDDREGFVNSLFSVLYASGQDTLAGVKSNLSEALPAMMSAFSQMDGDQRGYLKQALGGLVRAFMPDVEIPASLTALMETAGELQVGQN
jgi:hypothetical protein